MNVVIIGGSGQVGEVLIDLHKTQGNHTISIDRKTPPKKYSQTITDADVVYVSVLPLATSRAVAVDAAKFMKPGSLLISAASIESVLTYQDLKSFPITFAHAHLHFRPELPLNFTGKHLTLSVEGPDSTVWRAWIFESYSKANAIIHNLEPGNHDQITEVSQLVHMITAYLISRTWKSLPSETVAMGLEITGTPGKLLAQSTQRTIQAEKVVAEIIMNHPQTTKRLEEMKVQIDELLMLIRNKETEQISSHIKI